MAQILNRLGENRDALPIALATLETSKQISARGPDHPATLDDATLVGRILCDMRHLDEALGIMGPTLAALVAHDDAGPRHRFTLRAAITKALILTRMSSCDDAAELISDITAYMPSSWPPAHYLRRDFAELQEEWHKASQPPPPNAADPHQSSA